MGLCLVLVSQATVAILLLVTVPLFHWGWGFSVPPDFPADPANTLPFGSS